MLSPEILEYYERGGEHHRLAAGAGRLEFLRRIEAEPSAFGASSHLLTIAYRATP
ncbi:MAG: hypothetical protein ABW000_25390 [Actinoplanes sp.]